MYVPGGISSVRSSSTESAASGPELSSGDELDPVMLEDLPPPPSELKKPSGPLPPPAKPKPVPTAKAVQPSPPAPAKPAAKQAVKRKQSRLFILEFYLPLVPSSQFKNLCFSPVGILSWGNLRNTNS